MKHIKGLDTLRAFAVFFVIIQHFGVWFDDTSFSGKFIKEILIPDGGWGVHLFFVLSGFLITSILLTAKNGAVAGGNGAIIGRFYLRRALRIFPVYYFLLLILCFSSYPDIRDNIWHCATYTLNIFCYRANLWNNISHTWTLCVEEQFYLVWPIFMIMLPDRCLKYLFATLIITGIVSTYVSSEVQHHFAPLLVFHSFDAFGIGGLLACAYRNGEGTIGYDRSINKMAAIALIVYLYWKIAMFLSYPHIYGMYLVKTVDSVLALWIIVKVVNNKSKFAERYLLGNRFLNYIGKISYGVYLYHYVYLNGYCSRVGDHLVKITARQPFINALLRDHHFTYWMHVAIMIGIASLSYHLIELPILQFKDRLSYTDDPVLSA